MALEAYRKKRDFSTTAEPKGRRSAKAGASFVIQKHDATTLHYDFRLEMDGVLKSWAVTRGPSLVPGEKRLAVHVEDHPLEYGGFEGTIPKGQYGGGAVIIWDRGAWTPIGDARKGYAKGHLDFELQGEKLHGRWHLVRMRGKPREKRENWLLIKGDDEFGRPEGAPDILEARPESVKTGRNIADVAREAPGWPSKTGEIEKKDRVRSAATSAAAAQKVPSAPPDPSAIKGPKKGAKTPAARATSPRRAVKLTHPDRLYWPDEGVTKEGLADYYAEVWRHIAPFVVGRPLALVRCPNGIAGEKFFQKHAWKGLNPNIALVQDPKGPSEEPLISINDLDGLIGLVQSAVLEIHPWGSTVAEWERPDIIIMDLDPGEGVPWEAVIAAAEETRQRLKDAGLAAFVKTTGGKGLHVVAPLKPKAEWPAVRAFAKGLAEAMAADSPDRFVATIAKAKRGGKILVDYLRNQRGATAVAAYSTRARLGAPVSMPLAWSELNPGIGPAYFTVNNTPTRLASLRRDPWEGFRAAAAPLQESKARKGSAT